MRAPQHRRFMLSDFPEQEDWIDDLFIPLNNYMEEFTKLANNNLTITDNFLGNVQEVRLNRVPTVDNPVPLNWVYARQAAPRAVMVGNVQKADYTDFTLTGAVQVQWKWDINQGLRITNIVGITPTASVAYIVTLIVLAG